MSSGGKACCKPGSVIRMLGAVSKINPITFKQNGHCIYKKLMVDKEYLKTFAADVERALTDKRLDLSMKSLILELNPGDNVTAFDCLGALGNKKRITLL